MASLPLRHGDLGDVAELGEAGLGDVVHLADRGDPMADGIVLRLGHAMKL